MKMKMKKTRSAGYLKALYYLEVLLRKPEHQADIKKLRATSDIPEDGLCSTLTASIDYEHIPKEWVHAPSQDVRMRLDAVARSAGDLLSGFGVSQGMNMPSPILDYIFLGRFGVLEGDAAKLGLMSPIDVLAPNLFTFHDAKGDRARYMKAGIEQRKSMDERLDRIDDEFPIAFRISPYASLRDTLDYVQHAWPYIQLDQEDYKKPEIKLGKLRKRDPFLKKRNDFIFNFKGSRKEMLEKFLILFPGQDLPDEGAITAIKYREKQRRGLH